MTDVVSKTPFITNDAVVLGLLLGVLALIFKATTIPSFKTFFKYVPALLLCYFLPSVLNTLGLISPGWIEFDKALEALSGLGYDVSGITKVGQLKEFVAENEIEGGVMKPFIHTSRLYFMASRYLLPASLVLLTISISLKEVVQLGPKALIMFGTATLGVVIGGPIALLVMDSIAPDVVAGNVWRGMTTIAGSWIGGGANQAAMYEVFGTDPVTGQAGLISSKLYGAMITVDVIVAEIWMAFLLLGVGKSKGIDRWLKADSSSVETLKNKMHDFSLSVAKIPTFNDLMLILGIAFGAVGLSHFLADYIAPFMSQFEWASKFSLTSGFFWLIVIATTIGLALSFTKVKNLEGAGASKIGSVFIYILVASIGMKMNILEIADNPGLFFVGLFWMIVHVALLFIVAKIIRAPFFFLAVGSKANIGGAASAPVVAAAFHPSLAPVGVLLAVLGYALGTYGAILCGNLMQLAVGG
ncbi:DUF819 family protein [Phaeocystidibacter marisrubri]|uniref:DUF819 family protein n=1 Tax=Phaeocystidibacter marisrubri TaxID=1577780 RepID=A0A6L3ZF65_9FLAO|nr:DUF819 family protein [Phaeocystidibacter marisrubri]KAB2816491.1 DUF819 family protein [Phaeocystidibacter marisrubri]GGH69323.1 membrane protein [Phaeocystidibacter marisrubri]